MSDVVVHETPKQYLEGEEEDGAECVVPTTTTTTTTGQTLFEISISWEHGMYSSRSLPRLVDFLNSEFNLDDKNRLHARVIYKQLRESDCIHYKGVCARKMPFMYHQEWEASIKHRMKSARCMTIS